LELDAFSFPPLNASTNLPVHGALGRTPRGTTSALEYRCPFTGAFPPFRTTKVWKAHVEPKYHFYAWLLLHGNILTAENLAIRRWPHDPIYKLCRIHPESSCWIAASPSWLGRKSSSGKPKLEWPLLGTQHRLLVGRHGDDGDS
jgi:hypothetical protein